MRHGSRIKTSPSCMWKCKSRLPIELGLPDNTDNMSNQIKFTEVSAIEGVKMWLVDLRQGRDWPLQHLLADWERERAARFRFDQDARRYLISHAALRMMLADALSCKPEAVPLHTGAQGKPYLEGYPLQFNMSHSGDWALMGWHPDQVIGLDIETGHHLSEIEMLARHNFALDEKHDVIQARADERARVFLTCWTRKEACLKALGSGLTIEPHVFSAGTHTHASLTTLPTESGARAQMRVQSIALPDAVFEAAGETTPYAALAILSANSHHLAI